MTLALKPANARTYDHGKTEYTDDEIAAARKAFHLRPDANPGPWIEYARDCASWRHRVADWLVVFLVSPAEYLRRTRDNRERLSPAANTPAWRRAWEECYTEARQHVLDLAKPDQLPLSLAWEITERSNRSVLYELVHAGWLPRRPASPSGAPRRVGVSDAQRMADADELAAIL
jgi:hypothetical protein